MLRRGKGQIFCRCALSAVMLVFAFTASAFAEVTGAADNLRTGWFPDEPSLGPGAMTARSFKQSFKVALRGSIYAQPLSANGKLLLVTEDNWAYGLNPATGAVEWEDSFGAPVSSKELGCEAIHPHVGVTGTPVIDTTSNVAYFVSNRYLIGEAGETAWFMHAVDLGTGSEVAGFPVQISGTAENEPLATFVAKQQLQRPALLMLEGVVYAAFGSNCDHAPYQGWVIGVSTGGQIKSRWAVSARGGSIWQSGSGLISDGPGQILFTTANTYNPSGGGDPLQGPGNAPPEGRLGESVVRLQVQSGGGLKAADFFSPWNNVELDTKDLDMGSAGPIGLPAPYFGTETVPNLLVQASKSGEVFLLNRNNLGGMGQGPGGGDAVVQEQGAGTLGGVWDGAALWPGDGGYVYLPQVSKPNSVSESFNYLRFFKYEAENGVPKLSLAATSASKFGFGSGAPIVTSDGTTSGSAVLWITHCTPIEPSAVCDLGQLWAYSAVPGTARPVRIWKAPIGAATKFSRPDASNGHIYVGNSKGELFAFAAAPVVNSVSPASGLASGGTEVTIRGSNLTGAKAVLFGSIAAASFSVNSANSITAFSPAESPGTVHVTVTTPTGTSAVSHKDRFKIRP